MTTSTNQRPVWPAYLLGIGTVLIAGLLWQGLGALPAAQAQVPDSGLQRMHMVEELRTANKKLTEITGLLREIRDATREDQKAKDQKPARKPGHE